MSAIPTPTLRTHLESPGGLPACGVASRFPGLAYAQTVEREDVDCKKCLALDPSALPVPVRVRIYPENRALYAIVNVWRTESDMYRHRPLDRNHSGSCTDTEGWHAGKKRPQFAEVNLHRGALDSETVCHEITHAAWAWARRVGWAMEEDRLRATDASESEERFCYALGRMVRQFVDRTWALGLVKPKERAG